MPDEMPIEDMTLQERLKKADYLARELSEHLRQAYLPRLGSLRSSAKVYDPHEVSDNQILELTLAVLRAEEFTDDLCARLNRHLNSIAEEMREMLFRGNGVEEDDASQPVFDVDDLLAD